MQMSPWHSAQRASPTYCTSGLTFRNVVGKVSRGSGGSGSGLRSLGASEVCSGGGGDAWRLVAYQSAAAPTRSRAPKTSIRDRGENRVMSVGVRNRLAQSGCRRSCGEFTLSRPALAGRTPIISPLQPPPRNSLEKRGWIEDARTHLSIGVFDVDLHAVVEQHMSIELPEWNEWHTLVEQLVDFSGFCRELIEIAVSPQFVKKLTKPRVLVVSPRVRL